MEFGQLYKCLNVGIPYISQKLNIMLKIVAILMLLSFTGVSLAQNKIDQRLIDNEGEKIEEIYQFRSDYYNYLVYELNSGYVLLDKKEAKKINDAIKMTASDLENQTGKRLTVDAIEAANFNFKAFGLVVHLKEQTVVKIDKGNFLLIKSKLTIANEFSKSPLSHK